VNEQRARELAGRWLQYKGGPADVDVRHLSVAANALIDLVPEPDLWSFGATGGQPQGVPTSEGAEQIPRDLIILATGALFRVSGIDSDGLKVVIQRFPITAIGFPTVVEHREDDRGADRRYREWRFPLPGGDMLPITTDRIAKSTAVPSASELIAERLASLSGWQVDDALQDR
jgi:hypothetical protein